MIWSTIRWASLKQNYLAFIPAIEEIIASISATDVCSKVRGLLFK